MHHILDEINFILDQISDIDYDSFVRDPTLKRAFVRSLEIIGEASKKIPEDVRAMQPNKDQSMNGTNRSMIKQGAHVAVVQKQDQRTGKLTEGVIKDILTKSPTHPHGIKVRLESGIVGRVKEISPS
ncbi:MAG: YwbE family protein [Deltaproteobacteria bacterium]|nr:YwbE family protein [Deltaproteobacteria bacterium]